MGRPLDDLEDARRLGPPGIQNRGRPDAEWKIERVAQAVGEEQLRYREGAVVLLCRARPAHNTRRSRPCRGGDVPRLWENPSCLSYTARMRHRLGSSARGASSTTTSRAVARTTPVPRAAVRTPGAIAVDHDDVAEEAELLPGSVSTSGQKRLADHQRPPRGSRSADTGSLPGADSCSWEWEPAPIFIAPKNA